MGVVECLMRYVRVIGLSAVRVGKGWYDISISRALCILSTFTVIGNTRGPHG
jgi:hypothetical protein